MDDRVPAHKGSWSNKPMPEQHSTLNYNAEFTSEEFKKIAYGLIPQAMEDKWFIYMGENKNTLYLHRSWTGICIFEVDFVKTETGTYKVQRVLVNRNMEDNTNTDDRHDIELLDMLIKWCI